MAPYNDHWQRATDVLVAPWRARGGRRTLLRAGIGLALSFDTWRSLVRDHGLTDAQAIDVALRLVQDTPARHRDLPAALSAPMRKVHA
jgi:hypothetical protein